MSINFHKVTFYTIFFLIIGATFIFGDRVFFSDTHTHQGDVIDDSTFPIPLPSVQSTLDTTEIDLKMKVYFDDVVTGSEAFTALGGFDILGRMEELCVYYGDICDRIDFDEKTHFSDQYVYMLFTIYLISQVDANIQLEGVLPLREAVHSVLFYSDPSKSRGQAGHHNVLINVHSMKTQQEVFEVMTHEIAGHVLDLGGIADSSAQKDFLFTEFSEPVFGVQDWSLQFYRLSRQGEKTRDPESTWHNFVSGYGSHSPFEEFAEFANAWINHHYPLAVRAKNDPLIREKYLLFRQLFGNRYLNEDLEGYTHYNHDTIPFDTTRRKETQY